MQSHTVNVIFQLYDTIKQCDNVNVGLNKACFTVIRNKSKIVKCNKPAFISTEVTFFNNLKQHSLQHCGNALTDFKLVSMYVIVLCHAILFKVMQIFEMQF